MQAKRTAVGVGLVLIVATVAGLSQDGGRGRQGRRGGGGWMQPPGETPADALVTVATNTAVAEAIGLTAEQVASFRSNLDADKLNATLSAQRLADALVAALTDPQIAADLALTEGQQEAVKSKVTAGLLTGSLSQEQISRLTWALSAGTRSAMAKAAMNERMRQFDTDGDGQLSEQERAAAREAMMSRRGLPEHLRQYDTDGDGQLSEAERQAARAAGAGRGATDGQDRMRDRMRQFDTNGDGVLSDEEKAAARQARGR